MTKSRVAPYCFPVVLILICAATCYGQAATGTPPFGSFAGGPDVINLGNLNGHIAVPVFSKPGRGTPFTYTLTYDTSVWYPLTSNGSQSWQPVLNWGWNAQTQPTTGYAVRSISTRNITQGCHGQQITTSGWGYYDQFGVGHPFAGQTVVITGSCGPSSSSLNTVATDGSGYNLQVTGLSNPTITAPSGRMFRPPLNTQGGTGTYVDNNGNEITVNGSGQFEDTLGLTALTVAGNGTPSSPVTFTYTAPNGNPAAFTMNYTNYTVATNFGVSGIIEYPKTAVSLVSSISLPDGSQYTFTYEPTPSTPSSGACTPLSGTYSANCVTARLASVTLPTGGKISYAYYNFSACTTGNNGVFSDGSASCLSRTTPDGTWTYTRAQGSGSAWTTTITDPTTPTANQSVVQFQESSSNFYETQRQIYQGSSTSGTLLKTVFTCYNSSTPNCNSTAITLPISERDVYVQWPGTNGLESRTTAFYNGYGLVTEMDQYAYGAGAPGSVVRKIITGYALLGNGIVDRPGTIAICSVPGSMSACNKSGAPIAQTNYTYDQGSVTATSGTPQQVAVTGSRGNLTTASYMVNGSSALSKTFTYFDTGNVQTATDVNGAPTTYNYGTGSCGNSFPTSISESPSLSRSITWNCIGGVVTSLTDENNHTTSYTYNDADFWRVNAATDALGNQTTFYYQPNPSYSGPEMAWWLTFNNGNSAASDFQYMDGLGRTYVDQHEESPGSSTLDSVSYTFDSSGRPNSVSLPCAITWGQTCSTPKTTQTYDALGRKVQVTNGGGLNIAFSYSQNDTYRTVGPAPTNENTKQRQFEYDALGRLTSVCEVTGGTTAWPGGTCGQTNQVTGYWTQYAYDVVGHLTGVTQNAQSTNKQQTRSYTYDGLGRMTSETNPESGTTTYTYDSDSTCGTSNGDLVKKVDTMGNTTCITYDALHRITSATYPSGPYASATPSKYFVYDSATVNGVTMTNVKARLAEAYTCVSSCTSKLSDEGFSYTARGEASDVYESTPNSGGYYHVTAAYWANGALNQLSNLVGLPTITYNVDGEGRIYSATASSGQNPLTSTTYNVASEPTQVNLGSIDSDSYSYDPNTDRMTQYQFNVNSQSVVGSLTWNAIGSLASLSITDPINNADAQTCNYTHDDLTRLANASCGSTFTGTYTYDPFGNIIKSGTFSFAASYSYQTNQMTEIGGSAPTYDANGNVTYDFLNTYVWDANGRPVTADGVNLTYDALGRMVEQNKSGSYYQIVYTPGGAKLAITSGQTLQKAFVPLAGGSVAVYNSSGLAYYRHSDHLGSSRFASTPSRTLYYDGAYGPFGEAYAQTGTTDLSFTGMNQDTAANIYDFPAREYGIQGRWPSPDPAGLGSVTLTDPQTLNRYAYVRNSPLGLVDPEGMCGELMEARQVHPRPMDLNEGCGDEGGGDDDGGEGGGDDGGFVDGGGGDMGTGDPGAPADPDTGTIDTGDGNGNPDLGCWQYTYSAAISDPAAATANCELQQEYGSTLYELPGMSNPMAQGEQEYLDRINDPCIYLNDAGNGIESIDRDSDPNECRANGGVWAPPANGYTVDANGNVIPFYFTPPLPVANVVNEQLAMYKSCFIPTWQGFSGIYGNAGPKNANGTVNWGLAGIAAGYACVGIYPLAVLSPQYQGPNPN